MTEQINAIERAELDLRRAKEKYDQVIAAGRQPPPPPQAPVQPDPAKVKRIDLDKVTSIEDLVAVAKLLGMQIHVDVENPVFATVEHLIVDEEDDGV